MDAAQNLSWDQTPDVIKVINVFQGTFSLLLKASAKFLRGVFIKCPGCLLQYKRWQVSKPICDTLVASQKNMFLLPGVVQVVFLSN